MNKSKPVGSAVELAGEKVVQIGRELAGWQSKLNTLEGRIADGRREGENLTKKRAPLVLRAKANGDQAAQRDLDRLTGEMFRQSRDLEDLLLAAGQIGDKIVTLENDREDAIRWKKWAEFQVLAKQRMNVAEKVQEAFKSLVPLIENHLMIGREMTTISVVLEHDSAGNEHAITGAMNIQDFVWGQLRFLGESRPIPTHKRGIKLTDLESISIEKISHLEKKGRVA